MLDIVLHPNKILRQVSAPITLEDLSNPEFKTLISEMTETMIEKDGVGLAAPQIGKNIRLIIVKNQEQVLIMINPKIIKKSWAKKIEDEGCLSVLGSDGLPYYLPVARHQKISVNYTNISGEKKNIKATNFLARAIQHEIDHLDGVLFIDKALKNETKN